jgi:hypothetical protein
MHSAAAKALASPKRESGTRLIKPAKTKTGAGKPAAEAKREAKEEAEDKEEEFPAGVRNARQQLLDGKRRQQETDKEERGRQLQTQPAPSAAAVPEIINPDTEVRGPNAPPRRYVSLAKLVKNKRFDGSCTDPGIWGRLRQG